MAVGAHGHSPLAVAGNGIPSKYRGGGPAAVGGYKAQLFGDTLKIGTEIYMDELKQCAPDPWHRRTCRCLSSRGFL